MEADLSNSGLKPDEISEVLQSIRVIAGMPDAEALTALDKLLASLRKSFAAEDTTDDLNWSRQNALEAIERLRTLVNRVRSGMLQQEPGLLWDAHSLRSAAERCGEEMDPRLQPALLPTIRALKEEAFSLADEAEICGYTIDLRDLAKRVIHNAANVRRIIAEADATAEALQKRKRYSEDHKHLWRQAKERAARFRADKKREEAEVAAAGGNELKAQKAQRLLREADVLLRQDWAQAFPGETPPAELQSSGPKA